MRSVWSPQQERALVAIQRWQRSRDQQVFCLFGYAGTGKTEIARAIGTGDATVVYACFTGKAANVLRQRGCERVSTIHKLIYHTEYDPDDKRFYNTLKEPHELAHVGLIIIDEGSMVSDYLAKDLLSFERPLLIVGDPAQLPPPDNSHVGFFMTDRPDAMLTEIHRQAADNPILYLADIIRRGGSLPYVGYHADGLVNIVGDEADITYHDIVLVGRNETRHRRNQQLRRKFGFVSASQTRIEPQVGETVVCMRNDYSVNAPVFNGSTWCVESTKHVGDEDDLPILRLGLGSEDGSTTVQVPLECFTHNKFTFYSELQQFAYGYALTVHKAQGSEWDSVMLINESQCFRGDARRWLYTGITRARERLTIVDYG